MIIRSWRALAKKEKEAAYLAHFRAKILPKLRQLSGFRGATVLREKREAGVELIVMTRWDSMSAVRAFAGKDSNMAVVAHSAQSCFHSYEKIVTHHEVILDDGI